MYHTYTYSSFVSSGGGVSLSDDCTCTCNYLCWLMSLLTVSVIDFNASLALNNCCVLVDHIAKYGRMTEVDARKTFWQIIHAVNYCHERHVVHRDLKVSPTAASAALTSCPPLLLPRRRQCACALCMRVSPRHAFCECACSSCLL